MIRVAPSVNLSSVSARSAAWRRRDRRLRDPRLAWHAFHRI